MAQNIKTKHIPNVRERRAARLAEEVKAVKPAKPKKAKKVEAEGEATVVVPTIRADFYGRCADCRS